MDMANYDLEQQAKRCTRGVCFPPIACIARGRQTAGMKRVLAIVAVLLSQSAYASAQQTCSGPANEARSLTSVAAVRLAGRFTDQANILSAEQRLRLSRKLEQFEASTTAFSLLSHMK